MDEKRILTEEVHKLLTVEFLMKLKKQTVKLYQENDKKNGNQEQNYEAFSYWDWWVYLPGSLGFTQAFERACDQESLFELKHFYHSLNWIKRDVFEDEICRLLVKSGLVKEN